jgi:hypothetical protein
MENLTQKQQALLWWNRLRAVRKDDLALDYFGAILIYDDEIEYIWLKEVPPKKVYTEEEVHRLFEKLTVRNVFKTDRDYDIAKKTLLELTGIDYEAEIN